MKKITLLLIFSFLSLTGFAQMGLEGFESTTGPNTLPSQVWPLGTGNWTVFDNGVGTNQRWGINNTTVVSPTPPIVYAGTNSAYMNRENIGINNTSEDYLVTPLITVPTNGQVRFFSRSFTSGNQGTLYQVKIATANPTNPASYTLLQEFTEDQLSAVYNIYEEKILDIPNPAGSQIYIAFVMKFTQTTTGIGGDRWLLDNVRVASKCLTPTITSAAPLTLNGGTLTWSNPSGATSWEIEIIPATATPTGVANYFQTGTPSLVVNNLQPGTSYKAYIRAICSPAVVGDPTVSSSWSTTAYNFTTLVPGLTCASPVTITTLPFVTNTNTSAFGDTTDAPQPLACAGTATNYMAGNDAFYSYTATSATPITVTLSPTGNGSGVFVYQGCANVGVTCVGGAANTGNGPRVVTFTPVPGQTYIIVVSSSAALQTFPYNLTIIQNSCTNIAATFSLVSNCSGTSTGFFVRANVTSLGTATSVVATDNLTPIPSPSQTITAPGTIDFGPYPNGTNVALHLENGLDPNCFLNSTSFTQQFCPFTNDLCTNAIPVVCGNTQTQTTVGATTTGAPTTACGTSGTGGSGGLWYSYLGNGDVVTASLCNSTFNTRIQVVTGACGAFTCVAGNDDSCATQSSVTFITTPGVVYYIYVYGAGTAQGVFSLAITCVTPPPAPVNDNCATATVVPVNTDGSCTQTVNGTIAGALASPEPNTCVGTADDDVWYQFTATATTHLITFTNVVGSTTDINHAIYSTTNQASPCGALTQILCSNPNLSVATGLTVGNVYLIRVYTAGNTLLQTTTFTLCVSVLPPPPVNDECANAIAITPNNNTNCTVTTSGTLTSATPSSQAVGCGNATAANDDVWFSFVATAPTHLISLLNIAGTATNLYHALYSGTCGALVQRYCSDPENSTANNLVVGQTYYIRVYSVSTASNEIINFNICIGRPVQCADAAPFCGDTGFTYQNSTGAPSYGGINCLATTPNPSWFYMQILQSGNINFTIAQTSTATGAGIDVDYVVWGPFTPAQYAASCNNLYDFPDGNTTIPNNSVSCSYSAVAIENFTLNNVVAGNYYLVLITNYSNQPGTVTFTQNAGSTGATDCSIVCTNNLPADQVLCNQSSYTIVSSNLTADTYTWYNGTSVITGATSSSLTVTQSGTYTCVITCGLNTSNDSINITFNPQITPTFAPIAAICQNGTAPTLPTTSIEGVTGTWLPATINTATAGTTTYTFTPTTGLCAAVVTMSVTINAQTIPTFAPINNICQNSTAPTLPTTSIEGVTGTWLPATIDSTVAGTVTYTFTPTTGLCATTATLNVTVTGSITTTFTQIPNICQNSTAPALPTTSNEGVTGTWLPSVIDTSLAGTTNYTFTPGAAFGCASTFVMPITIDQRVVPTFTAIPNLCLNDTAPTLPTTSNNGIAGTWNSTISTATAGTTTYTFTPNAGICASTATIAVTVLSPSVPTFTQLGPFCQNSTAPTFPTTSSNGIAGTWNAPLSTSTAGTTTYTFTPNSLVCTTTTTMTVVVNSTPTLPTVGPIERCDGYVLPALPANVTYHTAANGGGTTIAAGTNITTSQLIYVFGASGTTPNCTTETSFNVTITSTPQFTIEGGCDGNDFVLEAIVVNNSFDPSAVNYSWTDSNNSVVGSSSTFTATQSGIYTLTVTAPSTTCTDSENFNVSQTACIIQKGISPNGDGSNDSLDLEGFNVRQLSIYNRYGAKVYTKNEYVNEWYGQTDKGDELPDGTYYFVIDRKDAPTKTGWVYINRVN